MKDGFIRVAAATPEIQVADCRYNREQIEKMMEEAWEQEAGMVVFPELCLTGYTCGDLFLQELLLKKCVEELGVLLKASEGKDMLTVVGMPLEVNGKLYNTAVVFKDGNILGVIPKTFIPNYSEFYEARHFERGPKKPVRIHLAGQETWFGTQCTSVPGLVVGGEICEDLWAPNPPSISHALAGATVMFNVSASDEITGKDAYRKELVNSQSARLICGYIYAGAGEGESTTDLVFPGHNLICENGTCMAESKKFDTGIVYADLDVARLNGERRRMTTFIQNEDKAYVRVAFENEVKTLELERYIDPRSGQSKTMRTDLVHPGDGTEEKTCPHPLSKCGCRYFRRTGLHAGIACYCACL